MTTHPIRIDRMQAGIMAWIRAALPSADVRWAPSELPSGADTVVLARLIAGPDSTPLGGESLRTWTFPLTATLRVLPALLAAGQDVGLHVSGRRFEFRTTSSDVTAARAGILAAIGSDPMVSASFTASGADAIAIAADSVGDVYDLAALESTPGLVEVTVDTDVVAQAQIVDVSAIVEIQAYSTSRYPRTGATSALSSLLSRRGLRSALDVFEAHGISINPDRIVNLDALSGPTWESRAAVSLRVSMIALAAEEALTIERARGTLTLAGREPPTTIVVDTEPPP